MNAMEKEYEGLSYKLRSSNDFTISFALMELEEFVYQNGFEKSFELVKEMDNRAHQKRALSMLYEFSKNHCSHWESSYESLIDFFFKRYV